MADLQPSDNSELTSRERELIDRANELFEERLAESTRRSYESGWRDFVSFCREVERTPLPAAVDTLAMYMTDRHDEHAPGTIQQRLAAIQYVHDQADEKSPTRAKRIEGMMRAIQRDSDHSEKEAPPLLTRHVKKMVDHLRQTRNRAEGNNDGNHLRALRDESVILVGYAGALRRSEIASIHKEHLVDHDGGYALLIPESKTDPKGQGQYVGLTRTGSEHCPCGALDRWLGHAEITQGPVFRGVHWSGSVYDGSITARTVHDIIQETARKADLSVEPTGHSLRAGHITQATINDVPDGVIRAQSRHKDPSTFYGYQRVHKALSVSSSGRLGL